MRSANLAAQGTGEDCLSSSVCVAGAFCQLVDAFLELILSNRAVAPAEQCAADAAGWRNHLGQAFKNVTRLRCRGVHGSPVMELLVSLAYKFLLQLSCAHPACMFASRKVSVAGSMPPPALHPQSIYLRRMLAC